MQSPEQPRIPIGVSRQRAFLLALVVCVFAVLTFPFLVIRPFVHQAASFLAIALVVQRWMPWLTVVALLAGVFLAFRAWAQRSERLWVLKDLAMTVTVLLLGASVPISRFNIYERMFRPLEEPKFVSPAEAGISRDEMVMAVRNGGEARAYPVLQMAYHHVLNDTLGGIPIVVTY